MRFVNVASCMTITLAGCGGSSGELGLQSSPDAGQVAPARCPPSGPLLAALPYAGSLYLPENFELFIQAFGAVAGDLQVTRRDGTPVASQHILTIAPGIFQIHPADIGCAPEACTLDVSWGGQSIAVGGDVHPFGGVDNLAPQFNAGLTLTNPELDETCPRPVALHAHMGAGIGPTGTNSDPQTGTPAHFVEMEDGAGGWTPVGGVVAFAWALDFDIYVDRGIGQRCFRAVAVDSAGNVTRDQNPVCLDPGL